MINVTVTYTDNLGPEADVPELLRRIAARLEADFGQAAMVGVCIGAVRLTDFVIGDGRPDWSSVSVAARLPEDQLEALREPLFKDLTELVETQLHDFEGRSSTVSIELTPIAAQNVVSRNKIGRGSPIF
jgi:5-carboxymethyl-2-hydroxymuconate isomerase